MSEYNCNEKYVNYVHWSEVKGEVKDVKGVLTWQDCWNKCKERIHLENCEYFTYHPIKYFPKYPNWCRLLSKYKEGLPEPHLVSGPRQCGSFLSVRPSSRPKSCTTLVGQGCVFPFVFKGVTHWTCTTSHRDGESYPWCPTKVNADGVWQPGEDDDDIGWAGCDRSRCVVDQPKPKQGTVTSY